ncbi:MAG: peptide chain release factor aRF-1 [Candidatus Hydrothermarchaeaceae archaeon]
MAKPSSTELHKLKKELQVLEDKKGKGTELISLYIPPDKNLNDVMSQMRDEASQAANIKSTRTRKNVQSALEVIMQRLKLIKKTPENGLVMFVGTIPRGIKDRMEVHLLEPPQMITTYIYRCDSEFLLDPIKEVLEEKGAYGLLVVDRGEATIGILRGKQIDTVKKIPSTVPRKHGRGGQSQRRFERLIEIAAHEYFKRIGAHASEIFMNTPDLRGIILGGPGPTKEFFYNEKYLHPNVQDMIVDTVDTSYTDEFGLTEIVDKSPELFKNLEIIKEKELMSRFLRKVVKDNGLAAYGEKEVREYLQMGAIDTLLFSEDVESFTANVSCSNCEYKDARGTKDMKTLEKQLVKIPCPNCSEKSLGIDEFKSTLDEFTDIAESIGAKVEVISTETEEGQQLVAFGGIAAILRFKP